MNPQRLYKQLPFTWKDKSPETIKYECDWLESIISNAAPFTDWWVKARIVQLAYVNPPDALTSADILPTYAGLSSETEIVRAVRSLCDLKQYWCLANTVKEEFVIKTLNSWINQKLQQTISRNFEIYEDRLYSNIFLVTSTATISPHSNRNLPSLIRYRPLFNIEELAQIIQTENCQHLTIRTHGYATPSNNFYKALMAEADELNRISQSAGESLQEYFLEDNHFYIGYHWPSEKPIFSPALWVNFRKNWQITLKYLLATAGLAALFGTFIYALIKTLFIPLVVTFENLPIIFELIEENTLSSSIDTATPWYWIIPTVFILWAAFLQILRLLAYQRDSYRAFHYGAPDLAEFFWRLDQSLSQPKMQEPQFYLPPSEGLYFEKNLELINQFNRKLNPVKINLIGHGIGSHLLINTLKLLAHPFAKDDRGTLETDYLLMETESGKELFPREFIKKEPDRIGDNLLLDKLILAAPDIPLQYLREGRNNALRSAMRRCGQTFLLSSDRDIVLRYLSNLANWLTEPSIEMSGYRLGNLYLKTPNKSDKNNNYRVLIRNLFVGKTAIETNDTLDLFEKFNYIDCSEMPPLNGIKLPLNPLTALPIDLANALLYFFHTDPHSGYFFPKAPSFALIKMLITLEENPNTNLCREINHLLKKTPLRFLPSQPFIRETIPTKPPKK